MTIRDILKELVLGNDTSAIAGVNFIATVESVDTAKYTCSVKITGSDGLLENVRLKAENGKTYGVVSIPEKGSFVIVSVLGAEAGAFVSLCSKVEKVEVKIENQTLEITQNGFVFNGGQFDGLVKIKELEQNLENIKTYLDSLNAAIAMGLSGTVGDAGAAAATAFSNTMEVVPLNFTNMENDKIKH
jgi:hypothetical protein